MCNGTDGVPSLDYSGGDGGGVGGAGGRNGRGTLGTGLSGIAGAAEDMISRQQVQQPQYWHHACDVQVR